jgi:trans-aconitate methyltransferase
LEIGCGTGISTLELIKLIDANKIIAVDISKKMINKAANKKELSNIGFCSDINRIKNKKFDLIFSSFSYHWWSKEQTVLAMNLLNEAGIMALCIPARQPDLLSGNLLISKAVKKIQSQKPLANNRLAGLSQKNILEDFSQFDDLKIDIKPVKFCEHFTNSNEFINILKIRGSLLALSKYYNLNLQYFENELEKQCAVDGGKSLNLSWKSYLAIMEITK